ncbi:hypothetical protein C0J52_06080 [Blattella germanica]|nr:hypothetical protein C0J52_06080 [Blattella germanica]
MSNVAVSSYGFDDANHLNVALGLAPCFNNFIAISSFLRITAINSGVTLSLLKLSKLHFKLRSKSIVFARFFSAAKCITVLPYLSLEFGLAPSFNNFIVISSFPHLITSNKGVSPFLLVQSMSHFSSRRHSTTFIKFFPAA